MLETDLVIDRLGGLAFELTCSLDPEHPRVERTRVEEVLVAKLFDLAWRIAEHGVTPKTAFAKLAATSGRSSILTAAIEYILDKRAKEQRCTRHRHDGKKPRGSAPSGLDCALRLLWRLAERDHEAIPTIEKDEDLYAPLRRMIRVAEAVRTLRAFQGLESDEVISAELAFVQGMWPFHDFEAQQAEAERPPPTVEDYERAFEQQEAREAAAKEAKAGDGSSTSTTTPKTTTTTTGGAPHGGGGGAPTAAAAAAAQEEPAAAAAEDDDDDDDDEGEARSEAKPTAAYPSGAYASYLRMARTERLDIAVPVKPAARRAPAAKPSSGARAASPKGAPSDDGPGGPPSSSGFAPGFLTTGTRGQKRPSSRSSKGSRSSSRSATPTAMDVDG